jgi:FAD/FMN-containing dehydrogenase
MTVTAQPTGIAHEFRARGFTGEVIDREHPAYDEARRVWNGSIDRRPIAIARCRDTEDVAAAVSTGVAHELPLAVRGGGHSIPGHSTCDDGLVIDLSPMRQVRIDPDARLARVAGGALLGDLDRATQEHGLAVPAGQVSHTGLAGLTLGGGVGYLMRKYGLTIDNLLAAQVVTAAGQTVRASADENEDLFFALRGGGGNFGVVTEFTFKLHEVGPLVYAGVLAYPFDRAGEVMRASREVMRTAPDELSIHEILITVPEHDPFPPTLQGRRAVFLVPVHVGTHEQAVADIAPLRELGPAFDLVGPMPYLGLQSMIDYDTRHGLGHYSKSHWLTGYEDALIDTLVAAFPEAPSPMAHLITARMGGAIERVAVGTTAFANRSAANLLWIINLWEDPRVDAEPHRRWVNDVFEATLRYSTGGGYVNAIASDEGPARVRAAYGHETFSRLAEIKRTWDPHNVFRLNANIPPAN